MATTPLAMTRIKSSRIPRSIVSLSGGNTRRKHFALHWSARRARHAACSEERPDRNSFKVREFTPHDLPLRFGRLNLAQTDAFNRQNRANGISGMTRHPYPDMPRTCQIRGECPQAIMRDAVIGFLPGAGKPVSCPAKSSKGDWKRCAGSRDIQRGSRSWLVQSIRPQWCAWSHFDPGSRT